MSLPNIIELPQTVWELWPAQDFRFRGDKYIMKNVRVVSLTLNIYEIDVCNKLNSIGL